MVYRCNGFVEFIGWETPMEFKPLILHEDCISFEIEGEDEDPDNGRLILFEGEGVAQREDNGHYVAEIEIRYPAYGPGSDTDNVTMRITAIELTPGKRKCHVAGTWLQQGDTYHFEGSLSCKKLS